MSSQTPAVRPYLLEVVRRRRARARAARRALSTGLLLSVLASCTSTINGVPAGSDAAPATPSTAADRHGWEQVGGDEFSASQLDRSTWRLYGGTGANGVGVREPGAVSVSDGSLVITASGDVSGGLAWQAQPATTYGRWEFRARVEAGTGYAPAILLWPDSDVWPLDGEIDVMEIVAGDRQVNHTTVHYGADDQRYEGIVSGDFTQWHTYAVDWQPSSITVYLDGDEIFRTTDRNAIPDGPMHLAVQLDVGPQGTWIPARDATTPDQVRLHVDWVRLYR